MNTWFQFKKFIIHQDKCAMKVTEIACIQGAWTQIQADAKTVLDIGCGTGLLSLMTAQKYPFVRIDAVEIDEQCYAQAKENIENSVYKEQISCILADIKYFAPPHQYDFIICNPPFFENDLKSPDPKKNTAWHSDELSLKELIVYIEKHLKPQGSCSILLPAQRETDLIRLCSEFSFRATRILQIRHSVKHPVSYFIYIFSKGSTTGQETLLTIREGDNYTQPFTKLLKEFYLKL